jgi:hypothetical protein
MAQLGARLRQLRFKLRPMVFLSCVRQLTFEVFDPLT